MVTVSRGQATLICGLLLVIAAVEAVAQPQRLELRKGDRVVILGNTLAERMQLFNHFETLLATRFPELQLTVRNLGWSGDTVALQPRPLNFGTTPTHLYRQKADVILAFFGLNESFDGQAGLGPFEQDLTAYLRANLAAQYNGASTPRLVLVSPVAHERLARLTRVDVDARNRELARYTEAMSRIAGQHGVPFVDLFTPTLALMAEVDSLASPKRSGGGLTINGIHLNEYGDRIVAQLLMAALGFEKAQRPATNAEMRRLEGLREAIRDKNEQFFYRWRPVNAEYVVGRRLEPFGSVNFPGEMKQLDEMVAAADRRIWQRAQALKGLGYPAWGRGAGTGAAP
jgi:lysophospholipase L1-like esterase